MIILGIAYFLPEKDHTTVPLSMFRDTHLEVGISSLSCASIYTNAHIRSEPFLCVNEVMKSNLNSNRLNGLCFEILDQVEQVEPKGGITPPPPPETDGVLPGAPQNIGQQPQLSG